MDYSKPTLLVVSGPNGTGKSTHINSMLPAEFMDAVPFERDKTRLAFENEIVKDANKGESQSALEKMEGLLFEKINEAITHRKHFVLETPLSHPDYWKYIDRFTKMATKYN